MTKVRDAFKEVFQVLADHPGEEVATLWYPLKGPTEFCVTARRIGDGAPTAVFFQPSPREATIWLADEDAEDLWNAANGGGGP